MTPRTVGPATATGAFDRFAGERNVLLTTYRRDGTPVGTPVHITASSPPTSSSGQPDRSGRQRHPTGSRGRVPEVMGSSGPSLRSWVPMSEPMTSAWSARNPVPRVGRPTHRRRRQQAPG
jgi:hypothetical protein